MPRIQVPTYEYYKTMWYRYILYIRVLPIIDISTTFITYLLTRARSSCYIRYLLVYLGVRIRCLWGVLLLGTMCCAFLEYVYTYIYVYVNFQNIFACYT